MRRVSGLLLVCLAQLLGADAAFAQSRPAAKLKLPAGFRALFQQPGWQAIIADGTIVLVEDGFTHLRGIDVRGQPLWRRQYQPAPRGMQELFGLADGALMYAGERLLGIEPYSGTIRAETKVPYLAGSLPRDADTGCWLNNRSGACSLSCACSFQLVSCQDGKTIGPRYELNQICHHEPDENGRSAGSPCGCWGSSGTVVGKSGDTLVATIHGHRPPNATTPPLVQNIAVGINVHSGAEIWHREIDIEPASYINGAGITPSGRTFWLGDAKGALGAFDCASGKKLWQVQSTKAAPPHMPETWISGVAAPAGIFRFSRAGATLYDQSSGTPRWSRSAAGLAFAVPRGALPTNPAFTAREAGKFLVLEPSTGEVKVTLELEHKDAVVLDAGHGQYLVQLGRTVRLHDDHGAVLKRATLPFAGTIDLGTQLLVASGTEGLSVLDLRTLAVLGSMPGWFAVVAVEKTLDARRLLVERYGDSYYTGEQKPRQIALLEVAAGKTIRSGSCPVPGAASAPSGR